MQRKAAISNLNRSRAHARGVMLAYVAQPVVDCLGELLPTTLLSKGSDFNPSLPPPRRA